MIEEARKRILLTETKSSIQELELQPANPSSAGQNWVLAMHVLYDETINDLRTTFRDLNDQFDPIVGVLTSHRVNEGLLTDLYPFSGNRYAQENLIGPIEDGSDYLAHRSKERNSPNESLEDVLEQIRKPGYLHKGSSKCPSGAVIRIFEEGARTIAPLDLIS